MDRTWTAHIRWPELQVSMQANPGTTDAPNAQMGAAVAETRAWIRLGLGSLAIIRLYKAGMPPGQYLEQSTVRQGKSGVIIVEAEPS